VYLHGADDGVRLARLWVVLSYGGVEEDQTVVFVARLIGVHPEVVRLSAGDCAWATLEYLPASRRIRRALG
jgi:hypothetical protein